MKKVFLVLTAVILSTMMLTACGGSAIDTTGAFSSDARALVGSWDFNGQPYYTFNEDGTGDMAGSAIRWAAGNGQLSVCVTPRICGTRCSQPSSWNYTLDRDNLNLSSRLLSFDYTRRR